MDSEQSGTRKDLAAFLRRNRRTLKLVMFDTMGGRSDDDLPTHIFYSRLDKTPFKGGTRFLDFIINPF